LIAEIIVATALDHTSGCTLALIPLSGNDLGVMFGHGREYQHAGTLLGEVDALGQELMHRFSMSSRPHSAFRHDAKADHR